MCDVIPDNEQLVRLWLKKNVPFTEKAFTL